MNFTKQKSFYMIYLNGVLFETHEDYKEAIDCWNALTDASKYLDNELEFYIYRVAENKPDKVFVGGRYAGEQLKIEGICNICEECEGCRV